MLYHPNARHSPELRSLCSRLCPQHYPATLRHVKDKLCGIILPAKLKRSGHRYIDEVLVSELTPWSSLVHVVVCQTAAGGAHCQIGLVDWVIKSVGDGLVRLHNSGHQRVPHIGLVKGYRNLGEIVDTEWRRKVVSS